MEILKNYKKVKNFVAKVQSHADHHKKSFGFLPASAYEQLALKGQLWVIATKCHTDVAGCLLFGGVYPSLKITQLFANPQHQGQGVGTELIRGLIEHARDNGYLSISARVASDLPANKFWEKAGFKISKQIDGSKAKGRIINIRSYQFPANSLLIETNEEDNTDLRYLEKPTLSTPIYALDLNPLFDITENREGSSEAKIILQRGFSGLCQICVTPEFKKELSRHSHKFENDPILQIAQAIPTCQSAPIEQINTLNCELRDIIFPKRSLKGKKANNDTSDLTHLSYCIAAGLAGFITREKAILKNSQTLFEKYKLKIISPEEIKSEDHNQSAINFSTGNGDVIISMEPLSQHNQEQAYTTLMELGVTEILAQELTTNSIPESNIVKLIIKANETPIGFTSWNKPDKLNNIVTLHFYIDENTPNVTQAIDHIIEKSSKDTKLNESARIDILTHKQQDITRDTASKRGFISGQSGSLSKIVYHGFLDEYNWNKFKIDFKVLSGYSVQDKIPNQATLENTGILIQHPNSLFKQALSIFDFETLISPAFLLYKNRECLLIPIQEEYANRLLGNVRHQASLFPSNEESLLIERAYFRACGRENYFVRGRLVMFYVSGSKSVKEIIGLARITSSNIITPEAAHVQFIRQGVLSSNEINLLANDNNCLHAFTFDNFMYLPKRMTYEKARKINAISPANLVTVEKLNYDKFKEVIDFTYRP